MIYTSYFGKLNKIPKHIVPIAICGKSPDWYTGLWYKKLAPKYGFFMEWKKTKNNEYYIQHFNDEVLSPLNAYNTVDELYQLCGEDDIVLLCYEKPGDFCHRHLVSNWLSNNGFPCTELLI